MPAVAARMIMPSLRMIMPSLRIMIPLLSVLVLGAGESVTIIPAFAKVAPNINTIANVMLVSVFFILFSWEFVNFFETRLFLSLSLLQAACHGVRQNSAPL